MLVKQFKGVDFAVAIDFGSIADYRALKMGKAAKMLMMAGGYAAVRVDFVALAALVQQYPNIDIDGLDQSKDGTIISILSDIHEKLTPEQSNAIIYHELGHLVNGDLDKDTEKLKVDGVDFILDEEIEIAADAFAMKYVTAAVLHDALLAVFTAREEVAVAFVKSIGKDLVQPMEELAECRAQFLASKRYAALVAAM